MGTTEVAMECDSNCVAPLIWASKYGNCPLVNLLLEQGDVHLTLLNEQGLALFAHAAAGHEGVVKLFLGGGVNLNSSNV